MKRRLQAEGLFDAARKRPIPVAPQGIALITSRTGAVLHDVLRVLRHGAPQARLVLIHSAVQGATAPAEIVEAIGRANDLARSEARTGRGDAPSVILLARGGGSSDDLAAFNNEAVLRAIAGSELPVLSAVGHESDATLADLVADDRAGTPSIGAARLAPNLDALRRAPLELAARARGAAVASIARAAAAFDGERRALAAASPVAGLERAQERLALVADDLSRAVRVRLRLDDLQVERAATLLSALSPFGVLARGYAMVEGGDGRLVRSWRQVAVGGTIRVRLEDGHLLRLNYVAANGHPYIAVGKFLIERKIISKDEMSMDRIRQWMLANPVEGNELRRKNKSYVFFRETNLAADVEPVGAQGVSLTPGRSIAVDRKLHIYGTPFFISSELPLETEEPTTPFRRLTIAQDTGGAIIGPARADIYFGAGDEAGSVSGRL